MSTAQIEGLWQYIQTLSLSKRNKKWLAERLLENETSLNQACATTMKAIKEAEEGKVTSFATIDDFKKHMYEL